MLKKIFLASIIILTYSQASIEAQMSISSVASLVKNIKNPALIAGGALAAVITLATVMNCCWINMSWANREKELCKQQNLNKNKFNTLSSFCDARLLGELISAQLAERDTSSPSLDALNTQTSKKLIKDQVASFSERLMLDKDCSETVKEQCEQINEALNNDDDYTSTSRPLQLIADCDWYINSRHNKKVNDEKESEALSLIEAINSTEKAQHSLGVMKKRCVPRDKAKLWSRMKLGYLSSLGLILYGFYQSKKA